MPRLYIHVSVGEFAEINLWACYNDARHGTLNGHVTQNERRQPFRGEAIHRVHGNTVAVRIDKLFVDPVAAALREPIDVQLACGKHYLTHGVVDLIPINVDVGKIVVAADLLNLA